MGIGKATGENRAHDAATKAINSPLLETTITGAKGVILNVTGGSDLGILEIQTASEIITEAADKDANIIIGAIIDETLGDEIQITVIATGFEGKNGSRMERPSIFGNKEEKGIFEVMREGMTEKKPEIPTVVEKPAQPSGDFYNKVSEDDGIDVPVFLRKGQE